MKKLFTSDKFFLISVILAVIGVIPFTIACFMINAGYIYMPMIAIINSFSVIGLYISYKKHNKNVMKGLIGFLLMGLLALTVDATFPLEYGNTLYAVFSLVDMAVVVTLCFNHFLINGERHSKSANILLNQILLFTIFVLYVISALIWLKGASVTIYLLYMCGVPLSVFGATSAIVCVESRLDAYKIDRENAGWSEEKGYPEGYIHTKEKY